MGINRIMVEPFNILNIETCKIFKKVNDHFEAIVKGLIPESQEEKYLEMANDQSLIKIIGYNEQNEKSILFSGILNSMQILNENSSKKIQLQLLSSTKLLDLKVKTHTYQNAELTYKELIEKIINKYNDSLFVFCEKNRELEKIIVQYEETDWEVLKRIASHYNTSVIPYSEGEGIEFYFGNPKLKNTIPISAISYSTKKEITNYLYKKENNVLNILENDELMYIVKEREIRKIGQEVIFKGENLYVYEIESEWIGGELIHEYTLKNQNGFKVPLFYNEKILGASLSGNIKNVSRDVVQAEMHVDFDNKNDGYKWFSYSTVYSSPDGTGWYVMPEIKDEIRLYFPTEKEHHGYIINSVHVNDSNSKTNTQRSNPDDKSLKTVYEKEVLLSRDSIFITNNNGLEISLVDGKGISIISSSNIDLKADEIIDITSLEGEISILGTEKVSIKQGSAEKILENNLITTKGSQIRIEEK